MQAGAQQSFTLMAVQVKDVEAAAARAAFESSHIIEEAMAQAADVRRQATQQAQQEVWSLVAACPYYTVSVLQLGGGVGQGQA